MYTKHFDKLNETVSRLGFGGMRFPTADGKIDRARAAEMLDTAYKAGVNYFDTAYIYHGGESESFMGEAMSRYPRESFFFATKLPSWMVDSLDTAKRIFEEQLTRLKTDYIDFYLLHALDAGEWDKLVSLGIIPWCEELKAQGRIRHFGFSFHDEYATFERILTYRDWDFCQLQLNYMDMDIQAGARGVTLAASLNVPIVIMEPVKGGSLAKLPEQVVKPFTDSEPNSSAASWALRYAASLPGVLTVLSGMSDEVQVGDNINTFNKFAPLDYDAQGRVAKVRAAIKASVRNGCTGCRYCMPCPNGVQIPRIFAAWNTYSMYGDNGSVRWEYDSIPKEGRAESCIGCGACESICPQKLPIITDLQKAEKELEQLGK